jgi:hypothetical protein
VLEAMVCSFEAPSDNTLRRFRYVLGEYPSENQSLLGGNVSWAALLILRHADATIPVM